MGWPLLAALALLSAAGPLGTDMYLPSLAGMVDHLHTTAPVVQLTMSAFMIGMGLGQLVAGPVSDLVGRKSVLIVSVAVFMLGSFGCAAAGGVGTLIAFRALSGLAGGAGVVVARAVIPDVVTGTAAASALSALMAIQGLAPVIAPLIGGFATPHIGWRGIFVVLAAINAVGLLLAVTVVPETLPPDNRSGTGLAGLTDGFAFCLTNRGFVAYTTSFGIGFGVLFSWIAASPFVMQNAFGFSPGGYAVVFAVNALLIVAGSALSAVAVNRIGPQRLLLSALSASVAAAVVLLAFTTVAGDLVAVVLGCVAVVSLAAGVILGNATALALASLAGRHTGAGSGLAGATQFLVAAVLAPLLGLWEDPVAGMAWVMTGCACVALVACLAGRRIR
ncbi:multidrug effflux MFS transporter [Corynebacterium mendelii]|uniref:Multidrug effflux MFS transporter n=1 Tax=Corynebacterium mendelii TaxID=2765362 RepID=A0A939IV78_9CORY|nr:multidrug effflux MFS transporter [Corynebacterium mendelii]